MCTNAREERVVSREELIKLYGSKPETREKEDLFVNLHINRAMKAIEGGQVSEQLPMIQEALVCALQNAVTNEGFKKIIKGFIAIGDKSNAEAALKKYLEKFSENEDASLFKKSIDEMK